jgi:hypothetical protein
MSVFIVRSDMRWIITQVVQFVREFDLLQKRDVMESSVETSLAVIQNRRRDTTITNA